MKTEPADVRFWRYTQRGEGCWEWTGQRDSNGYGRLQVGGRSALSHRISWAMHNGPIPAGAHVLHHCDNRPCVRPDHLFLGDNAANVADRVSKGRSASMQGASNPKARLTGEQVKDIRERWRPSRPGQPRRDAPPNMTTQLAIEYGVTPSTIYHIARGWTWH